MRAHATVRNRKSGRLHGGSWIDFQSESGSTLSTTILTGQYRGHRVEVRVEEDDILLAAAEIIKRRVEKAGE